MIEHKRADWPETAKQPENTQVNLKKHQATEEGLDPALKVASKTFLKAVVVLCLLLSTAFLAAAQVDGELVAKRRVYAPIGPGLRAVRHGADGKFYVLASPNPGLIVFSPDGKKLLSMRESAGLQPAALEELRKSGEVLTQFGEDCDVDADGTIYVADRGANAIQVYAKQGRNLKTIPVNAPVSVAALAEGEVAVATFRDPSLVVVFDKNGRRIREFGDMDTLTERSELNRFLNVGVLAADDHGHLYYGYNYFPEPTVKQFDSFGYAKQEVRYTALDAQPAAQALRREIEKQERKGDPPIFKRILTAIGVDRETGEVWMAMGDTLLLFDKDGNRRATYLIYTPDNSRLEANVILVLKDRLIIGGDPIGIYEFDRPEVH